MTSSPPRSRSGPATPARPNRVSAGRRTLVICAAIVLAVVAGVAIALAVDRSDQETGTTPASSAVDAALLAARPDSRQLTDVPGSTVTFVEFLDFECEACGAFYPYIEQLRADYGTRATFVVRYFPLPSHFNAERAARAVEAAAQQGRFEDMYAKMFQTQSAWGEQQIPKDDVFRGFAAELGLDMAAWDAAYQDPATLARVNADVADGRTLGVQGTPTFFVNGERLQPQSYQDLTDALDTALG